MVRGLSIEIVRAKCLERGFRLISYRNIRTKVVVECLTCNHNPQEYWWSQIRDGQICRYCSGAVVDLLTPFRNLDLKPLTQPLTHKSLVAVQCQKCNSELANKTSYKNLLRRNETPCWICSEYQARKRNLFFSKGWELASEYTKRERKYTCQCRSCGHHSLISGSAAEKWSANCPTCREIHLYRLIGERLNQLNGRLLEPLSLKNTKSKTRTLCKTCGEVAPLTFKDVIYGGQGFCKNCGVRSRAATRRKDDIQDNLERLGLIRTGGDYINEDSKIQYKCAECDHPGETTVGQLRIRTVGCLECNDTSPGRYTHEFFNNKPEYKDQIGALYLILFKDSDGTKFLKVGIHKVNTCRVAQHKNKGGKCIQYIAGPLHACFIVEQNILRHIREQKIKYWPKIDILGGKTECFNLIDIDLETFWLHSHSEQPKFSVSHSSGADRIVKLIFPALKRCSNWSELSLPTNNQVQ